MRRGKSKSNRGSRKFKIRQIVFGRAFRLFVVVLPYLIAMGFVGALFGASYAFAVQSDLFTLNKVRLGGTEMMSGDLASRFAGLRIGERMFTLD